MVLGELLEVLQGGEGLFILINMTASCAGMKGSGDEVHSYPDSLRKSLLCARFRTNTVKLKVFWIIVFEVLSGDPLDEGLFTSWECC